MNNKLIEKVLQTGDVVIFDPCDSKAPSPGQSYGRAEFFICLVWKYAKLKMFFVYPARQRDVKYFYRIECGFSDSFSVQSWTHKGIQKPEVWLHFWCKEHKCPAIKVYVPANSNQFTVQVLSTAGIDFDYSNPKGAIR